MEDIVGEYDAKAYGANFSVAPPLDIVLEFKRDGTFATNLLALTTGRPGFYGKLDTTLAAEGAPPFIGAYRVVSPSQLILAAGSAVTTVATSCRDGLLSFHDASASAFIVARKRGSVAPDARPYELPDFVGVYKGSAIPVDPVRQSDPMASAEFTLTLTDLGTFLPEWKKPGTQVSVFPFSYYRGSASVDQNGLLFLTAGVGGSDYGDASAMPFFDWELDGTTLHFTAFSSNIGSHIAVTLDGSAPHAEQPAEFAQLTKGVFRGSAFRVVGGNAIEEIPDVTVRFDSDGTFHSNWSQRLSHSDDDLEPSDTGEFRLMSSRHLVLGYTYEGVPGLIADATTDFYLSSDLLCFTSFRREAYFVFTREAE